MTRKQSRLTEGFVIDTSALIDINREYPPDVFPKLWKDIEILVKQGLLIAPKEVFEELKRKDDELKTWAQRHQEMFIDLDDEQLTEMSKILTEFPRLIDHDKTIPEADPFIIALAKCRVWTVITSEHRRSNPDARPKIPDVCDHYNIKCIIKPLNFFREKKWKY